MMPKRTNEFQRLIYFIQHELSDDAIVTESKMLTNIHTGSLVEVDIVIESVTGGISVLVSVECTSSSSRSATVEWIREMSGKHQDLPTNKLVLVSSSGFSKEAEAVAKAHGIETFTFKDAESFDWSGMLSLLVENSNLQIAKFDIRDRSWSLKFHPSEQERIESSGDISFDENCQITNSSGEGLGTIQQLGISMLRDRQMVERIMRSWIEERKTEFQLTWKSPAGTQVADSEGNRYGLQAFVIKGYCDVESTPVELSAATYGETQVAYGKVPDIFTGSTGEVTVFFTEREGEKAMGGLGFSSDSGFGKAVFPMQRPSTKYNPDN